MMGRQVCQGSTALCVCWLCPWGGRCTEFLPQEPPAALWICPLGTEVEGGIGFAQMELGLCKDTESQAKIIWLYVEGQNSLCSWATSPEVLYS